MKCYAIQSQRIDVKNYSNAVTKFFEIGDVTTPTYNYKKLLKSIYRPQDDMRVFDSFECAQKYVQATHIIDNVDAFITKCPVSQYPIIEIELNSEYLNVEYSYETDSYLDAPKAVLETLEKIHNQNLSPDYRLPGYKKVPAAVVDLQAIYDGNEWLREDTPDQSSLVGNDGSKSCTLL